MSREWKKKRELGREYFSAKGQEGKKRGSIIGLLKLSSFLSLYPLGLTHKRPLQVARDITDKKASSDKQTQYNLGRKILDFEDAEGKKKEKKNKCPSE